MEKRLTDRLLTYKRKRRSYSKSMQIPDELIIEILSKLDVKSIARFRCVSKDWASILRSSDFTNLFLKESYSRPRLLFTVQTKGKWLFLSAPQPLNPDKNSYPLATDNHMSFPTIKCSLFHHAPVNGLLCTKDIWLKGRCKGSELMIYNPSTGQSISLPKMRKRRVDVRTFFGYDPINKQYKVLCMSICRKPLSHADEHQVLTLGIKNPSWKMIECSVPHFPGLSSGICINGVLYYLGYPGPYGEDGTVVCFDVRSEKFKFIKADYNLTRPLDLINYFGKLGVLLRHDDIDEFFRETTKSLKLLVLDDVKKNEWSEHIFVLPPLWKNLVMGMKLDIVGMTSNGELVFSPIVVCDPFYVFFYNVERNTIARLRIQGLETNKSQRIQTYIDHVEDVKLI